MLLALDVGNTNITIGAFAGRRLLAQRRLNTACAKAELERALAAMLRRCGGSVNAVVYGSVVPSLNKALERAVFRAFGLRPTAITPLSALGIRLRVRRPSEVGADRILNALAAFEAARGAAVVIDFGTATTFDCVSRKGDYLGGAILPGPRMAAEALSERTAQLPLVAVRRPRRVVGKDTVECIQAGLYFGYLGMIEKVLTLTLKEMRPEGPAKVYATGGLSRLFRDDLPRGVSRAVDLTLQGLRIAHARLRQGGKTI